MCPKLIFHQHNDISVSKYCQVLIMSWMCGPTPDVVSKSDSFQYVESADTREVRQTKLRNPAAFTLIAATPAAAEKLPIARPPPWLPEHMCLPFDCVTEVQLIMRARVTHRQWSLPPLQTLLLISLWISRQINQYKIWHFRSDTHKICVCPPFVHLITKTARNAYWLQKQVACRKSRQKRKREENLEHTLNRMSDTASLWTDEHQWWNKPAALRDSGLILQAGMFLN